MSARWDDPVHIVLNLLSVAFLAVVLLHIVRAPADWLGGSRWAKAGWAVVAVGLTSVINGVYLPVGPAIAFGRLVRGRSSERRANRRFPCGSNIPGRGVRSRTSWPLAELVITDTGLQVRGRGLLSRLGGADAVRLDDVASAQTRTSRFGGGVCLDVRGAEPWYIFTFRPERVLETLNAVGVPVISGARQIGIQDQM